MAGKDTQSDQSPIEPFVCTYTCKEKVTAMPTQIYTHVCNSIAMSLLVHVHVYISVITCIVLV